MPVGARFYVRQARKVIDGTRCYANETTDICVDGVCVELGCDRILGSGLREDKCRECGGNGTKCRTVEGLYGQTQGLQAGYNDILLIPVGATNIEIREIRPSLNYLAIRNLDGKFYLNGNWRINPPSTLEFAGTKFHYSRPRLSRVGENEIRSASAAAVIQASINQLEVIKALGPTNETLFVVLLHQELNQGIAYEYSIPFSVYRPSSPTPSSIFSIPTATSGTVSLGALSKYSWIFGDYSSCSRSCGNGTQTRSVYCAVISPTTGKQEQVSQVLCDPTIRPQDSRPCVNEKQCPAIWYQGIWSHCSCVYGVQTRAVFCTSGEISSNGTSDENLGSCPILPMENCNSLGPKPVEVKRCKPENCPIWITSDWTACDARCGQGWHNRTVKCGYPGKKQQNAKTLSLEAVLMEPLEKSSSSSPPPHVDSQENSLIQKRQTLTFETTTLDLSVDYTAPTVVVPTTTVSTILTTEAEVQKFMKTIEIKNEKEDEIYVNDSECDPETRPLEVEKCFLPPCDETGSVEWITSAWSSCDQDCGPQIATRKVVCATRMGQVFSDDVCLTVHTGRQSKPADTRQCPERSTCSKSLWFTSEWSTCSVTCGTGSKTRHVFCGHVDEITGKMVPDEDESKCIADLKPQSVRECEYNTPCTIDAGIWLAGPLSPCTLPCGSGQSRRPLFCMKEVGRTMELLNHTSCSQESTTFSKSEACNIVSCDEDQTALIITCKDTEYGCCPTDSATPANEDYRNCLPWVLGNNNSGVTSDDGTFIVTTISSSTSTCSNESSKYGCCIGSPNIAALGPFGLGCPINCNNTRFGCCSSDGFTVANGTQDEGCTIVNEVFPTTTADSITTTLASATTTIGET